jgi:ornithine cyclodeaminase/alanine dehydrogenase-like protein (mu-crystallin family)
LLTMPCFINEIFGTKILTVFPDNAARKAPVIDGVMLINDGETGAPLALLNGRTLTALRTGALGGTSIRHLTPEDVKTVGIIGAGVQGYYQALCAAAARKISDIFLYDLYPDVLEQFQEKLSQALPGVRLHKAANATELVEACEVIITTTTSQQPVIPDDRELFKGKHFVGIGSFKPNMREYPQGLFPMLDDLFIDTEHGKHETGDLIVPIENGWYEERRIRTLGSLLLNPEGKEEAVYGTTLFKSVGMALYDLCAAQLVYQNARDKGLGQEIDL